MLILLCYMDTWSYQIPVFISSYLSHLQCFILCSIRESQPGFVIWIWKLSNSPFYNGENWGPQRPSDIPKVRRYIRALQRSKPTGYKRRFTMRKLSPSVCKQETLESWRCASVWVWRPGNRRGQNEIASPAQSGERGEFFLGRTNLIPERVI